MQKQRTAKDKIVSYLKRRKTPALVKDIATQANIPLKTAYKVLVKERRSFSSCVRHHAIDGLDHYSLT